MENASVKIIRACYAQTVDGKFGRHEIDSTITVPANIAGRLIGSGKAIMAAGRQEPRKNATQPEVKA